MNKMTFFISLFFIFGCASQAITPDSVMITPQRLEAYFTIDDTGQAERFIFETSNPKFTVKLKNTYSTDATNVEIVFDFQTVAERENNSPYKKTRNIALPANSSSEEVFTVTSPVSGFYRASVSIDGVYISPNVGGGKFWVKKPVIGVKPRSMAVANDDKQADFNTFWTSALAALATVPINAVETLYIETATRIIYNVTLDSWNGGKVKGYLSVPKTGGQHPAILTSHGYSSVATVPTRTDEFIEFSYNVRGQGLDNDLDKTGEYKNITWFVRGLEKNNKDDYYYKGAYLDVVRALDYLASRSDVNTTRIFAQGESQGGAFTFIAAALGGGKIKGAASSVPFLGDFRNYYKICSNNKDIDQNKWGWPMNDLDSYITWKGLDKNNALKIMSYFDIKNFAGMINCDFIMDSGLQDGTCPPSINFAAFNNIASPSSKKKSYINYDHAHNESGTFRNYKTTFFRGL